jgi:8-oxo-dGTP pyrophosphatase MutT (NUDIX family)
MTDLPIIAVDRLDLRYAPQPWRFADDRRAEIDAHFATLCRDKPSMWNGRVLVLTQYEITGRTFSGTYLETDFASFIAWRDWRWPDPTKHNCFGLAALRAADGPFLIGVMGAHTANAGGIYFPGGTPDPTDVVDGKVDLDLSVMRELAEETGLTAADVEVQPGWLTVLAGPRIAMMKTLRARLPARELADRVHAYLAPQAEPELAGVRIVRGPQDFDPLMPAFVQAFLLHAWRQ